MSDNPKVLVAEDDADIREVIRTRLQMAGYEVHSARTGLEALSKIRTVRPQALVLDINMPEMDGFGVLDALSKITVGRLPTLVLTALHASEDVKRAMRLGAVDYLNKPFNASQLVLRVNRLLRMAQPDILATTASTWI